MRLTLVIEAPNDGMILDAVHNYGEFASAPVSPGQLKGSETIDGATVSWRWENEPAPAENFVLIVRDPDAANDITTWGDVQAFDYDLGSSFDGKPQDEETAINFVGDDGPTELDCVPVDHPLYKRVMGLYYQTCGEFENARKILDAYDAKRRKRFYPTDPEDHDMSRLPTDAGEQLPKLATIRAYRILPGDNVWGIEHDGGFHITEPFTCDKGALPVDGGRVNLGPIEVTGGRLMLVEVRT
jgi:hypothetical protein